MYTLRDFRLVLTPFCLSPFWMCSYPTSPSVCVWVCCWMVARIAAAGESRRFILVLYVGGIILSFTFVYYCLRIMR